MNIYVYIYNIVTYKMLSFTLQIESPFRVKVLFLGRLFSFENCEYFTVYTSFLVTVHIEPPTPYFLNKRGQFECKPP